MTPTTNRPKPPTCGSCLRPMKLPKGLLSAGPCKDCLTSLTERGIQ